MKDITMGKVRSADGTTLTYERSGDGEPVVLVDPAGGYSGFDNIRGLGNLLAERFTVFSYDRRGRGQSTDTPPYAVEREVEDLAAMVAEAGGPTCVYAFSSGGLLALHAAAAGVSLERMALFEPPVDFGDRSSDRLRQEVDELVTSGRRGDAVRVFLASIGVPPEVVAQMAPFMPALESIAHTLVYDCTISEATTRELVESVSVPTLVLDSQGSSEDLMGGTAALVEALPHGALQRLTGRWHGVPDRVLAPVVAEFFRS